MPLDLVPNPQLAIRATESEVELQTPDREQGLRAHTVRRDDAPRLYLVLRAIASADGNHDVELDIDDDTWMQLQTLGVLVPADAVAREIVFTCRADEPRTKDGADVPREDGPLLANPTLRVGDPRATAPRAPLGDEPVAWITDAGTGASYPYVVQPDVRERVASWLPGTPVEVPRHLRAPLVEAGIAVAPGSLERRAAAWRSTVVNAARRFAELGFVVLRALWPPAQIAALADYYRAFIREGHARHGDEHVSSCFVRHDERMASFVHAQLTPAVESVVGEPIKPSYSYLSAYVSGAIVKRHVDREQSEFVLSLLVDAGPGLGADAAWPLRIDLRDGSTAEVRLSPGDGVIFRGRELPHHRPELPQGHWSTSIILSYVRQSFAGPLD